MARFYSNENFPLQCVEELRRLGHDVLTSFEAGNANRAVPDEEVLSFAAQESRILLTQNRRHFLTLHIRKVVEHAGIIICTFDPNSRRFAESVHRTVEQNEAMKGNLFRVVRPSQ